MMFECKELVILLEEVLNPFKICPAHQLYFTKNNRAGNILITKKLSSGKDVIRCSKWCILSLKEFWLESDYGNSHSYVTFQDPGKKYLWASLSRWNYTIGMSSITLCCNILIGRALAFKLCCSNDTAHAHLVWILFPPSKNLKEMQKYFKLNIGPCVCLITCTSPSFHQAQKNPFIFVVNVWSCGIFSCYLSSSTFMRYAFASGAE